MASETRHLKQRKRPLRHPVGKALTGALLTALIATAQAQSPERLKEAMRDARQQAAAIEQGRKASFLCANCHGVDGNSKQPEVPNLAGQNAVYLLNQMNKFYTGARKDQWMEPAIKLLSEAERLAIVVYYANQKVTAAGAPPPAATGRENYAKRCTGCHGPAAHGDERFPRLAGQQKTYLVQSLTRYRDRTGARMEPEMLAMAASLKDAEIRDLADYLSALP